MLEIKNLSVELDGKTLLSDINFTVPRGARVRIDGPNGCGKTTLVQTIMGNPQYIINKGKIIFDGRDITTENTTTRALLGIFLGAQNVPEIAGLTWTSFLKYSAIAHSHFETGRDLSMGEFLAQMDEVREQLNIPREWLNRGVNVGFSGGERKRMMLMQLCMTSPKLAILDEPDSGADAALQSQIVDVMHNMPETTFLFISHQPKFTEMAQPTHTIHMSNGKIIKEEK